jgi:predicted DCC family thiol-disulfide oxidoreductase YuxK
VSVTGRYVLIYDGHCEICCAQRDRIARWDGRDVIDAVDMHVPDLEERFPGVQRADCYDAMHLITPSGEIHRAAAAVREVVRVLPWVGWIAVAFRVPGVMWIADRVYRWVAANRYRWNKSALQSCEDGACSLHLKPPVERH